MRLGMVGERGRADGTRWKVMALAVAVDLLLGEPPPRWHPVVWMGRLVAALERTSPRQGSTRQLLYGVGAEAACLVLAAAAARRLEHLLGRLGMPGTVLLALALKPAFALRELFGAVGRVQRALERGDLPGARRAVGEIVSRDVETLDEPRVVAAAVESLSENASDSVVAPLVYYAAFGLPGAYVYRMANTMDAMWGYRGQYEYLGKAAARLDDLLNLVPSRLAAMMTAATCWAANGSPGGAWRGAMRDASRTASPNAGWPMAAMAGALDVRLEKVGNYILNAGGRTPRVDDLRHSVRAQGIGLGATVLGLILASRRRRVGD